MPLRLRGALGSLVQEGKPITADWALAWYLAAPAYRLRTPAKRCFPEFLTLFEQRFAATYPNGLLVSPPRRRLSARYRAASGAFTVDLNGEFEKLPDVVALTAPLAKIDQIAIACTAALDPYSRLVGRDPAAGETVTAQLTLPEEFLRNPKPGSAIAALKARIETLVPRTSAMIRYEDLRKLLEIAGSSNDKATKSEAVAVAGALERLGFAIEPDPRHGGPTPPIDADVMLFRLTGNTLPTPYHLNLPRLDQISKLPSWSRPPMEKLEMPRQRQLSQGSGLSLGFRISSALALSPISDFSSVIRQINASSPDLRTEVLKSVKS